MSTGIVIIAVFLVLVFVMGFPTRRRMERAYTPAEGPHPLVKPFLALARKRREWRDRRRRRHLRSV